MAVRSRFDLVLTLAFSFLLLTFVSFGVGVYAALGEATGRVRSTDGGERPPLRLEGAACPLACPRAYLSHILSVSTSMSMYHVRHCPCASRLASRFALSLAVRAVRYVAASPRAFLLTGWIEATILQNLADGPFVVAVCDRQVNRLPWLSVAIAI